MSQSVPSFIPSQIKQTLLVTGRLKRTITNNNSENNGNTNSISIGLKTQDISQASNTISIGTNSGVNNQNIHTIAIGTASGNINQQNNAVSVGIASGQNNQGMNSIALGRFAGQTDQSANTIILNATGNTLNSDSSNATYIAPVRGTTSLEGSKLMFYDTTTKEVTYTNDGSIDLSCGVINDVSGINFCDGTYIGQGNSFDISTNEVLKVNENALVVDTSKNIGIGTVQPTCSLDVSRNDAIRLPTGTKSDRPHPAKKGMLRLLSETNEVIEFYDGVNWLPVQSIHPILNDVTPKLLNQDISNTLTLTGEFFPLGAGLLQAEIIGQDGTKYAVNTINTKSNTEADITIVSNNSLLSAVNNEPFSITIINTTSNLKDTLNSILIINEAPQITTSPGSLGVFPVQAPSQDPNASFVVEGTDPDNSPPDASFVIVSTNKTPGGFELQTSGDISGVFSVPNGSRTDVTSSTFNITLKITDADGGESSQRAFSFSLANPSITSITPDTIAENSGATINVNGDFFVIDSSSQFIDTSSSQEFPQSTSYVSKQDLSLSNVNLSANSDRSPKDYDLEIFNGIVSTTLSNALTVNSEFIFATGGEESDITVNGENYRVHQFKTVGTHTFSVNNLALNPNNNKVEFLIVAGGGSGGAGKEAGGGGGAGGVIIGVVELKTPVNENYPENFSITVGSGGNSVEVDDVSGETGENGENGGDSFAFNFTVKGGGGGGSQGYGTGEGEDGGSGGGGADDPSANGGNALTNFQNGQVDEPYFFGPPANETIEGFGNEGGSAKPHVTGGGGGGGAGEKGEDRDFDSTSDTGKGGDGIESAISGSNQFYGGGGGGSSRRGSDETIQGGEGGLGGGGAGAGSTSKPGRNGVNGSPNTGGGGGGADGSNTNIANNPPNQATSGAGGSGIVIIRYII